MATNYLSASLLSDNYQNLLDADEREFQKQLHRALENSKNKGASLDANNPLRNDDGVLLSFSNILDEGTEERYQTVRIFNGRYNIKKKLAPSVLEEKMEFSEIIPPVESPTADELLSREEILDEKIKQYEKLISDMNNG